MHAYTHTGVTLDHNPDGNLGAPCCWAEVEPDLGLPNPQLPQPGRVCCDQCLQAATQC